MTGHRLVDQFGLFFIERGQPVRIKLFLLPRRNARISPIKRMGMKDHAGVIGVVAGPGGNQACQVAV